MTRYYVEDGSHVNGVKAAGIRKCLMQGSKSDTPFENKPQFEIDGLDGFVYKIGFFAPGNESRFANKIFILNDQTKISLDRWEKMCRPVDEYHYHKECRKPSDDISRLIKLLEAAAVEHGIKAALTREQFDKGHLTSDEARESYKFTGSKVKAAREELKTYIETGLEKGFFNG